MQSGTPEIPAARRRSLYGFQVDAPDLGPGSDILEAQLTQRQTRERIGLELESRPESVSLVRSVLSAIADSTGLGQSLLNDLKTAVSEACNNVVLHAYGVVPGQLLVTIEILPTSIDINVRDHGRGIRQLAAEEGRMGLGLGLMTALSTRVEFRSPHDGGTEVRMSFERWMGADGSHRPALPPADELPTEPVPTLPGSIVVHLSSPALIGPVFGRLARAVAATSGFSVTRFHDLYPIADALAEYASRAVEGPVSFSIDSSRRIMELVGGPFNEAPEVGAFGELVDRISVERDNAGHTLLRMTLLDQAVGNRAS